MDTINAVVAVGNLLVGLLLMVLWGKTGNRGFFAIALFNLLCALPNAYFAVN